MVNKTAVVLCVICVVLAVGIAGTLMLLSQKEAELQVKTNQISDIENEKLSLASQISPLQNQVSGLQTDVTALETEKSALDTQVVALQNNVSSLQSDVTSLEDDKSVLETQVSGLEAEVTLLEDDKSVLEQQVTDLQTNASILENQVDLLESEKDLLEQQVASLATEVANLEVEVIVRYEDGYAQGVDDLLQTGYYFMDPTNDEALAFIESDETDKNPYTSEYVCYDFTADFISNAAEEGYICGFVYIEYDHTAHAIACFNTTDAGLIFVEPQNDELVDVAVGQYYLGKMIEKMGIIW